MKWVLRDCWACNHLPRLYRVLIGFFSRHQTNRVLLSLSWDARRVAIDYAMAQPRGSLCGVLSSLTGQAGRRSREKTMAEERTTEVRMPK